MATMQRAVVPTLIWLVPDICGVVPVWLVDLIGPLGLTPSLNKNVNVNL